MASGPHEQIPMTDYQGAISTYPMNPYGTLSASFQPPPNLNPGHAVTYAIAPYLQNYPPPSQLGPQQFAYSQNSQPAAVGVPQAFPPILHSYPPSAVGVPQPIAPSPQNYPPAAVGVPQPIAPSPQNYPPAAVGVSQPIALTPQNYPPAAVGVPQPFTPSQHFTPPSHFVLQPFGLPQKEQFYYYQPAGVFFPTNPSINAEVLSESGPQQQPQQQPQQHEIVGNDQRAAAPVSTSAGSDVSFVTLIVFSCLVFWFGGFLFGGIAFILAMIGQNSASVGDTRGAIQLKKASYGLSIAGIVIGVIAGIVIGIVLGVVY